MLCKHAAVLRVSLGSRVATLYQSRVVTGELSKVSHFRLQASRCHKLKSWLAPAGFARQFSQEVSDQNQSWQGPSMCIIVMAPLIGNLELVYFHSRVQVTIPRNPKCHFTPWSQQTSKVRGPNMVVGNHLTFLLLVVEWLNSNHFTAGIFLNCLLPSGKSNHLSAKILKCSLPLRRQRQAKVKQVAPSHLEPQSKPVWMKVSKG